MAETGIQLELWRGPSGLQLPSTIKDAGELLPYALGLTKRQQDQIVRAFEADAYDMAAEYAWKRAMVKLKETISTLGMKFIGEMLGRDDVDDSMQIESVITDYTAIDLAEQLGIVNKTGSLKLKQSNELISHYFSKDADGELDFLEALRIVRTTVEYVLGEQHTETAIQFSHFRERLIGEALRLDDPEVEQIVSSPVFYLRTVLSVLLYAVRNHTGARLEHAIANLSLLLPEIWKKISDAEKWQIGAAYRDTTSAGNTSAASGIKSALLKVNGFDYVPENLRSNTFITAAKNLLRVHFDFNNFYNEPAAILKLSQLGTVIPKPALIDCMQAYLAVYLGNHYGVSNIAAPIAYDQLCRISEDRWEYYFSSVVPTDEVILQKHDPKQIARFSRLLNENFLTGFYQTLPRSSKSLYKALVENDAQKAKFFAGAMYNRFRTGKRS